jgi:hypothetical protein
VASRRIGQQGHWSGLKETELWTACTERKDAVPPSILQQSELTIDVLLETLLAEAESR